VGAGRGGLLKQFLDRGFEVQGIEIEQSYIEEMPVEVAEFAVCGDATSTSWISQLRTASLIVYNNKAIADHNVRADQQIQKNILNGSKGLLSCDVLRSSLISLVRWLFCCDEF
jgi:hypothetical protein